MLMNKQKLLKIAKWTGISLLGFFLLVSILLYAFREKIIQYVVREINQHLAAKVEVKKIDLTFWRTFPRVSVDFKEVLIFDTIQNTNDTVFYSELVRLKFDALKLWNKKYELEEAQIFPGVAKLKVYEDERENYLFFKTNDTSSSSTPINFKLDLIKLYQFRLSYENKITQQFYNSKIDELSFKGDFQAERFDLQTKAELTVLSIKNQEIQLIKNKKAKIDLKLLINKPEQLIQVPSSTIEIEHLPFIVEGFISSTRTQFNIKGKNLQLQEVTQNLLADNKNISQYKGKGMVTFDLSVKDDTLKSTPVQVNCIFKVQNGQLTEPNQNLTLSNINIDGHYSNEKGFGKEFIHLKTFNFTSSTGPFDGQFLLTNFSAPHYKGIANGKVNLAALSNLLKIKEIERLKGIMESKLQFDVSTINSSYKINDLTGNITLNNSELKLVSDPRTFSGINGNIIFNKNEAYVEDLTVRMTNSDMTLDGEFKNIEQFLSGSGNILANAELRSNYINVLDFDVESSEKQGEKTTTTAERTFRLPVNIDGNLHVSIHKLRYKSHEFINLRSNLKIGNRRLAFSQMNVENAGNSIQGALVIEETSPEYLMVEAALSSNEINFKKLFKEWNNFEQEIIKEENINGHAVINMRFKAPFDLRSGIVKNEITSTINLKIINGTLKNVDIFKSVMKSLKNSATKLVINKNQLNLFEQRLMNLQFDVLENNFTIHKGKVTIPEMKINSSALDLTLSGWHTFENLIDYRFSFRFRDVKTINRDSEFGIIEDDGTGFFIFMKMTGLLDDPQISWDKDAKKEQQKENREKAKQEALSILKSEFGFNKKDSTIREYQHPKKKEVVFEVDYGDKKEETPVPKEESKLKKSIDEKINKAKQQQQKEVEFEIE